MRVDRGVAPLRLRSCRGARSVVEVAAGRGDAFAAALGRRRTVDGDGQRRGGGALGARRRRGLPGRADAARPTLRRPGEVNVRTQSAVAASATRRPLPDVPLPYPAGVDVRAGADSTDSTDRRRRPRPPPPAAQAPAGGRAGPAPPSRARTAARPSSPSPAAPAARSRASARGGRSGRGTTPGSRASGCRACSPPPGGGPCRRTRRASGSGTGAARPRLARSAWTTLSRRDLRPGAARAGRSAATGLPFAAGSGTAAASPIAHTPARPATAQYRSAAMRPPPSSGSPSLATTGCGLTPAVQTTVRRRDDLARGERRRGRGDRAPRVVSVRISMPAPAQLRAGELRELGLDLHHHPLARLDEHEAHARRRGSAGSGRSRRRRSPAARRGPRGPRSRAPTKTKVSSSRWTASSGSISACSRDCSSRLRSAIASGSVLKPTACSASPGIGSVRDVEPSATISWS